MTRLSGLTPPVSPFQKGYLIGRKPTQGGGNARETRVALPWANMFGPFGACGSWRCYSPSRIRSLRDVCCVRSVSPRPAWPPAKVIQHSLHIPIVVVQKLYGFRGQRHIRLEAQVITARRSQSWGPELPSIYKRFPSLRTHRKRSARATVNRRVRWPEPLSDRLIFVAKPNAYMESFSRTSPDRELEYDRMCTLESDDVMDPKYSIVQRFVLHASRCFSRRPEKRTTCRP